MFMCAISYRYKKKVDYFGLTSVILLMQTKRCNLFSVQLSKKVFFYLCMCVDSPPGCFGYFACSIYYMCRRV